MTITAQHVFKGVDVEGGMTIDQVHRYSPCNHVKILTIPQYLQTVDEMIFTNIGITSAILVFMFEQLAHHGDFQQKLYEEITSMKARADSQLNTYICSSSTLLHYLCMEVVRLQPALGMPCTPLLVIHVALTSHVILQASPLQNAFPSPRLLVDIDSPPGRLL